MHSFRGQLDWTEFGRTNKQLQSYSAVARLMFGELGVEIANSISIVLITRQSCDQFQMNDN